MQMGNLNLNFLAQVSKNNYIAASPGMDWQPKNAALRDSPSTLQILCTQFCHLWRLSRPVTLFLPGPDCHLTSTRCFVPKLLLVHSQLA